MRRFAAGGIFLLSCLAGTVAATQYVARAFGDAPALGAPVVVVEGTKVYSPLAWSAWQRRWGARAPRPFAVALGLALGGVFLGLGAALRLRGGDRAPKPVGAYGTARWATVRELATAGLLEPRGIVLGQTAEAAFRFQQGTGWRLARPGRLLRHDGPEHALVFAPTRSGKGVGVVVPTLLAWTGSVLVYDPKRENWDLTAGWRQRFSHCLRFEPTARHSVRFNPLLEVRPAPLDVRDAQNIAEILVNPETTEEQRDHWKLTGHAFLVAAILHVLYAEEDKSLAGVLKALTDPARHFVGLLHLMLETHHLPSGPHPAVAGGAREMLNRSENERSGVLSTAISFLELYRDPLIAANTSSSDFTLADIMCAERPVSLYLVVPPSDFDRTRPVMRLLLNFFGRRLTEHIDHVDGPGGLRQKRHRLLYLIDEFPSLGRMPFFVTSLAFLAGYRIKCLLIAQSLNQLDQAYAHNNAILDNCHLRVTYGANDERTARRISDLLGQASLMKVQISEGKREGILSPEHVSRSHQEYGRALRTPDELLSLPYPDAIVMMGNLRPYLAKKVLFYDDARFRDRAATSASGDNRAPDSVDEQRAELPRPVAVAHWLRRARPLVVPSTSARARPGQGHASRRAQRAHEEAVENAAASDVGETNAIAGVAAEDPDLEGLAAYTDFLAVDEIERGADRGRAP